MLTSALEKHKLAFSYTDVNKTTAVSIYATWWLCREAILLILINIILAAVVSLSHEMLIRGSCTRQKKINFFYVGVHHKLSVGFIHLYKKRHVFWRALNPGLMNSADFSESHSNMNFYSNTLEICSLQTLTLFCDTPSGFTIYFAVPHFLACPKKVFSSLYQHFKKVCEDGVSEKKKKNPGEMKKREATTANQ